MLRTIMLQNNINESTVFCLKSFVFFSRDQLTSCFFIIDIVAGITVSPGKLKFQ